MFSKTVCEVLQPIAVSFLNTLQNNIKWGFRCSKKQQLHYLSILQKHFEAWQCMLRSCELPLRLHCQDKSNFFDKGSDKSIMKWFSLKYQHPVLKPQTMCLQPICSCNIWCFFRHTMIICYYFIANCCPKLSNFAMHIYWNTGFFLEVTI